MSFLGRSGQELSPVPSPLLLEEDKYEDLAWVELSPTDQVQDGWEWLMNMQPDAEDSSEVLQQKVRHEQRKDPFVHSLFSYAESGIFPKDPIEVHWVKAFGWRCEVRDGILYYSLDSRKHEHVPVVPSHLRRDILHESHSAQTGGHFSARRTTAHLKCRYWWPYMHQRHRSVGGWMYGMCRTERSRTILGSPYSEFDGPGTCPSVDRSWTCYGCLNPNGIITTFSSPRMD